MTAPPAGTQQSEPTRKTIYWQSATPDDFGHVRLNDWIEGVGDVSTVYEQAFIRRFGEYLRSRGPVKIPLPYTKININVKVGVPNEEFGRRSDL